MITAQIPAKFPMFSQTPKVSQSSQPEKEQPKELTFPELSESLSTDKTSDVSALIAERGTRYGEFLSHARITQAFKLTCADYLRRSSNTLAADQTEALDMIFHKIGRIINGDPNYADSWIDIAGYAKLVSDRLEKEQKGDSALKPL